MFALVPSPEIITDSNGIKGKKQGRLYQECLWDWIYDVATFRSSGGSYTTLLSYSADPEKRSDRSGWIIKKDPKGGILAVSASFMDYVTILKEIKDKATNAQFDKTTEKIIRDGIQVSTARKIFWIVVALFFVAVSIYFLTG